MMLQRTLCLAFAAGLILAGCGPNSNVTVSDSGTTSAAATGSAGSGPTTPGEQRKQTALAELQAKFLTLPHVSPHDDNQLLVAYLKTNSAFLDARVGAGGVIATFFDGEPYVIFNDQAYDRGDNVVLPDPLPPPVNGLPKAVQGDNSRLLTGRKILLVNGSRPGLDYNTISDSLGDIYKSIRKTNPLAQFANPGQSYGQFKAAFKGLDLMVWMGHSAGDIDKDQFFLMVPLDPQDPLLVGDTTNKRDDGAVIRAAEVDLVAFAGSVIAWKPQIKVDRFAVTPLFFQRYATFNQGSIVFMGSCDSQHISAASYKKALKDAGVSFYAGWTLEAAFTDFADTANALFDAVAGSNRHFSEYHADKSPSRPWSWGEAIKDLPLESRNRRAFTQKPNYHLDQSYEPGLAPEPSYLFAESFDKSDPNTALLVPSIENLVIDETTLKLYLTGNFPTTQNGSEKVTLSGQNCPILSWAPDQIVCNLPASGGGSVVLSVDGIESNSVPLTEWTITTTAQNDLDSTYDYNPPSTTAKTTTDKGVTIVGGTMKIRADIHGARSKPSSTVKGTNVAAVEQGSSVSTRSGGRVTDNRYRPSGSLTYTSTPNSQVNGSGSGSFTFDTLGDVVTVTQAYFTFRIINGFTVSAVEIPARVPPLGTFTSDLVATMGPPLSLKVAADFSLVLNGPNVNFTPTASPNVPGETVSGGVTSRLNAWSAPAGGALPDKTTSH